ncbi:PRTRC system protein A [Novosphingobium album (ex Liu et al. 2023)]|uniref:PRTRC system protein A n=1 Tax=Novosphingobium album (ex Liu et al. 2023) TaxID=3031130 RepID=A0ABT5WQK9_9SPHN|nr:PRTRC system protein A [Novosphingobium album (ex Liu et al. 2023)]MDE8652154.1 PRTRC system protein A [Novosphingobium album (ex Liu et al. 2023)]
MSLLAGDPTAAAILAAMPCYPVPPAGQSPAIGVLREAGTGQGLAVGHDGVMLILRRPWLALDFPIAPPLPAYVPYGSIGGAGADLRCGPIPRDHLARIIEHFRAALPNEAAAFVLWHEASRTFAVEFPAIEEATPSRLVYRSPVLLPGWHMVCDLHSHGTGPAFFSATDDADDAHATKIALVIGRLDRSEPPMIAARLCAGGLYVPLPRSPFTGDADAA